MNRIQWKKLEDDSNLARGVMAEGAMEGAKRKIPGSNGPHQG
jgi:hypothetical protein